MKIETALLKAQKKAVKLAYQPPMIDMTKLLHAQGLVAQLANWTLSAGVLTCEYELSLPDEDEKKVFKVTRSIGPTTSHYDHTVHQIVTVSYEAWLKDLLCVSTLKKPPSAISIWFQNLKYSLAFYC